MHVSLKSGSIFSEGKQQKRVKRLLRVSKTLKVKACVTCEREEARRHCQLSQACLSAQKETRVFVNERWAGVTQKHSVIAHSERLSAVWSIASAWKERRPFENKPFPSGLERLLCKSLLKQSDPQHLHQRERQEGWLHVCHSLYSVFLYVFWECSEGVWWRGESCQRCTQRR